MYLLGYDIGSSSVKASLVNAASVYRLPSSPRLKRKLSQ